MLFTRSNGILLNVREHLSWRFGFVWCSQYLNLASVTSGILFSYASIIFGEFYFGELKAPLETHVIKFSRKLSILQYSNWLNRTHFNDCSAYIFRRGWTKWLYCQGRNGVSRIAKWRAARFSNMECNAYQVCMFWSTQAHFKKVMLVIHQMFHLYLNWCNLKKKR